jgi:hypothetical protein
MSFVITMPKKWFAVTPLAITMKRESTEGLSGIRSHVNTNSSLDEILRFFHHSYF